MSDQLEFETMTSGNIKNAMSGANAVRADLWLVPVDQLRIASGFNVRDKTQDYAAKVEWLATQMQAHGFLRECPLTGYVAKDGDEDVIYITAGHRRLEAARLAIERGASIEKVPVITHTKGTNVEEMTVKLVTENNGDPLKPLEVARVCHRLMGYGLDCTEIGKRLSFTTTYVNQLLDLLSAPSELRDMVQSGEVSATLAVRTLKKEGSDAIPKLKKGLDAAKAKGKTKVTSKHLEKPNKEPTPKAASLPPDGKAWVDLTFDEELQLAADVVGLALVKATQDKLREKNLGALQ
jgi:ParB-like chromosome segregation protein Spo0J